MMNTQKSTEDCFANSVQEFLICTTVHKAKQTGIQNGETFVRIRLGKHSKNTKGYMQSENPFFNEYFVFEINCTLTELLRYTIIYELRRRLSCKKDQKVSELSIDLHSVWNQPNRSYYKKWGRLETPIGVLSLGSKNAHGYLQVDLVIVSQNIDAANSALPSITDVGRWQIYQDFDDIESNLLQNVKNKQLNCNIRYSVFFYHANLIKRADYLVQVSFAGNHGKTNICKGTESPIWNQEISFTWMYPSLAQTFLIQLFVQEHFCWKCIADYELHFNEIAFDAKPTFGPTYIQLYATVKPTEYIGRLLMEVRSECMESQPVRELVIRSAPPIVENNWWQEELYTVEFIALQGYFFHGNISSCKLSCKMADRTSDSLECLLMSYSSAINETTNLKYFYNEPPYKAIHIKIKLPDLLEKYDGDFFIQEIIEVLREDLDNFRVFQLKYNQEIIMQAKCLSALTLSFCTKLRDGIDGKRLQYHQTTERTQWDNNRNEYLENYFTRLHDRVRASRQKLRIPYVEFVEQEIEKVLIELQRIIVELSGLLQSIRVQDEWPDLSLIMSSSNKEIGISRLNAKFYVDVLPSPCIQRRLSCWKLKSFIFKNTSCQHTCINCGCIVGIVHGCLAIIADRSRRQFKTNVLKQWKQTEEFYWSPSVLNTNYNCRIFVHQAKVRPGHDSSGLCDARVRVVFCSKSIETDTIKGSLAPIWNVVFSLDGLKLPGSVGWYIENPPLLAVELYDLDRRTKDDNLGCAVCAISILNSALIAATNDDETEEEQLCHPQFEEHGYMFKTKDAFQKFQVLKSTTPPPLKWVPISVNGSVRAELLISAELVATDQSKEVSQQSITMIQGIPIKIRPVMQNFVLEVVFVGFRNYKRTSCCGCTERHRCKVMLGELVLKSGLTTSRLRQSMNFFVMYASGVVSLPCQLEYWPAMVVTDFTESSRGNEVTIGAALIPDCRRFIQRAKRMRCCPSTLNSEHSENSNNNNAIIPFEEEDVSECDPLLKKHDRFVGMSLCARFWQYMRMICHICRKSTKKQCFNRAINDLNEANYSWWTKFYNSLYMDVAECPVFTKHRLTIFYTEIEKMPEFNYFNDWAVPVKLVHGLKSKKNMHPREQIYATLKMKLKLTPCSCSASNSGEAADGNVLRPLAGALNTHYQQQIQALADLCKITARVYIVQCLNLRPHDKFSQSDGYVRCQLGAVSVSNRANYVANQSNPIFGASFQLDALLPREHVLEVAVFDHNKGKDDLIGATVIDLEDRWRSRHRCTVGLPREYNKSGYNAWRDINSPLDILKGMCEQHNISLPRFRGSTIEVDGMVFTDQTQLSKNENLQERLSLTVLRNLEVLPSFGYTLMPEHVETRSLYRNDCPGIPQGKIQLWIELYEGSMNLPGMLDITPQPPKSYEVRVIIHNCKNVALQDKNIFGTKMSDVYVKGWCSSFDQAQTTDIHYRSLNGEAQFNWRMIFPLQYSNVEDMMLVKRKASILQEQYEIKQPAVLTLQILDDDILTRDDFLGMLEINLSSCPPPAANAQSVKLYKLMGKQLKPINLFQSKTVKGWFPLKGPTKNIEPGINNDEDQLLGLTGKIELELEICTDVEAALNPCGLGRNPPKPLPEPDRPDTSFSPWRHPWKAFNKIFWPRMRKYILICVIVILVAIAMVLFVSKLPYALLGFVH